VSLNQSAVSYYDAVAGAHPWRARLRS
jgi:hypothetical protein